MSLLHRVGAVAAALVVGAAVALPAVAAADEPTDYSSVIATLDREIPAAMAQSKTVGLTIALVDGNRTVLAKGYGSADVAAGQPVAADTLFHIGSASKTLTAAAVMQLVEQGRVDLDAPLSRYVPEFSMLPRFPGSVITVRSVLDMHSGIPGDINNGLITTGRAYPNWRDWLVKTLAKQVAERPANTAWAYSNTGYVLLQNLVENVTGEGFEAYTRDHLFAPMGMTASSFDDADLGGRPWARPYAVNARNGAVHERPREYMNGWAAGSVVSSATDMAAYLKTMIGRGATPTGGRILQAATVQQMLTPQTDLPLDVVNTRQGLGWYLGDSTNAWMGEAASWNGDTIYHHTFLRWLPETDLGVFVSVNTASPVPIRDAVGVQALGLMLTAKTGRTAPAWTYRPGPVIRVAQSELRRVAGRYSGASGLGIIRATRAGLLWTPGVQNPDDKPLVMLPRAGGWYARAGAPAGDPLAKVAIKPVTVDGRDLLLVRSPSGATELIAAGAERLPRGYRIPRAWRARVGEYRSVGELPRTYPQLVTKRVRLTISHGVLLFERLQDGKFAAQVLVPEGPRRAFTFGFSAGEVQRGDGDLLRPQGDDRLTILGETYERVGR